MSRRTNLLPLSLLLVVFATLGFRHSASAGWQVLEPAESAMAAGLPGLSYVKRSLRREADGKTATLQLALFSSMDFRLEVIDLGGGGAPLYPSIPEALRKHGCPAGVNGGFFLENLQPMGLMVAQGQRIHRFESYKLLSGVVFSDAKGIHLVRRAAFVDHPHITALLQTGPFLVERAQPVRGLSPRNPDRRTFIATDWRRNWAIGSCSAVTLEELGELLCATPSPCGWAIDRAINLDGGSSSAFFFDRADPDPDVVLGNWKRVRNALGLLPRR